MVEVVFLMDGNHRFWLRRSVVVHTSSERLTENAKGRVVSSGSCKQQHFTAYYYDYSSASTATTGNTAHAGHEKMPTVAGRGAEGSILFYIVWGIKGELIGFVQLRVVLQLHFPEPHVLGVRSAHVTFVLRPA